MSYNYRSISNNPEERQRIIYPYCFWENAFTDQEIDKISSLMNQIELEDAFIAGVDSNTNSHTPIPVLDNVRRSKVSFHVPNNDNQWIFDRLNGVIEAVNNRWFNFDLNGYDKFQYTEYHSNVNGHYDWHTDLFLGIPPHESHTENRKLSVTFLLNEPGIDFEGGDLQFGHSGNFESATAKKGTLIFFPSFELHRVTPVTKGTRKSIVVWVVGPKWR